MNGRGRSIIISITSWIKKQADQNTTTSLIIILKVKYKKLEHWVKALLDRLEEDETFVQKWLKLEKEHIEKKRKKHKQLIEIDNHDEMILDLAA